MVILLRDHCYKPSVVTDHEGVELRMPVDMEATLCSAAVYGIGMSLGDEFHLLLAGGEGGKLPSLTTNTLADGDFFGEGKCFHQEGSVIGGWT